MNLEVQGEALFRDHVDPRQAQLRFQAIADADADADGEVTLAELGDVALADVSSPDRYLPAGAGADAGLPNTCSIPNAPPRPFETLRDFVYCGLAPTLVRYGGDGACQIGTGRGHFH